MKGSGVVPALGAITTATASPGDAAPTSEMFAAQHAVSVETNDADSNEVTAFECAQSSALHSLHRYQTDGRGSGGTVDPLGSLGFLSLIAAKLISRDERRRRSTARREVMPIDSTTEGLMRKFANQGARQAALSGNRFRVATVDELETLCDIDRDASRLFDQAGLELSDQDSLEFAAAERSRWRECLQAGTTLIASDRSGEPIGFAALRLLDHEPYLEQLSVRLNEMRKGIGTALLSAAGYVAAQTQAHTLWLTTYRHLAWNAPFYARAGFAIVSVEHCGVDMGRELQLQRRLLPAPEYRVAMRKVFAARR
jgi:GNAT superfamily N-acetyltransferase